MTNGRQRRAFKATAGEKFCLVNAAKPGAHCGLRLPESVELLGDEYRYFFCEYGSADAPHNSADAKCCDSSRGHEKSSLMVLLRVRVFQDDDIVVPHAPPRLF